ncbi:MAG: 4Fe-4S binding protein [Candidatus Lokiarchaeota archaeon]|nr:4Fe-4S binding protein [Candidatus Lokiarchaeota archaeon]
MAEVEADNPERIWQKAAAPIIAAGILPFPPSDTFISILKAYLTPDEAAFIGKAFKIKQSQTMEQLLKSTKGMAEADIVARCESLARKGFMFNQPNSSGTMVYRLLPLVVIGVFEYTFMHKDPPAGMDKATLAGLAKLYEKLLGDLRDSIQNAYDSVLPIFQKQPPVDRTVPLLTTEDGKEIKIEQPVGEQVGEQVLIAKNVADIIKKFDDIAVGNCFCRAYRKMLGHDCVIGAPMEVCMTFGKSARHVIQQGFARRITKDEALAVLKASEDAGLVHKAFHNKSDVKEIENSICNCCPDCCDTFQFWRSGSAPMVNYATYLAKIIVDGCTGCGTCETKCPVGAARVDDGKARVQDDLCIGCGVCAHFCPENTISLLEKPRVVFQPPPRLATKN